MINIEKIYKETPSCSRKRTENSIPLFSDDRPVHMTVLGIEEVFNTMIPNLPLFSVEGCNTLLNDLTKMSNIINAFKAIVRKQVKEKYKELPPGTVCDKCLNVVGEEKNKKV